MIYLLLYLEFFKIGLFAIGGGFATLPFLYQLSYKTAWFSLTELADIVAMSSVTPGPLGVNMAVYAGFNTAGVPGGIIATLGLITPAIITIIIIAGILHKFMDNKYVIAAFKGLRPAVCALLTVAVWEILKTFLINPDLYAKTHKLMDLFPIKSILFFVILLIVTNKYKLHPFIYIVLCAAVGFFIQF